MCTQTRNESKVGLILKWDGIMTKDATEENSLCFVNGIKRK